MEDKAEKSSSSTSLSVPSGDKDQRSPRREKKDKESRRASSGNVGADMMLMMTKQTGIVHEKDITECPVEFVTVFSDRAEITRQVSAKIEKEGVQKITVQGFPTTGGAGHATIFEVGLETKTITSSPQEVAPEMHQRLLDIPVEIELLQTKTKCLVDEQQWLIDMSAQKKHITENNKMNLEEISTYFKFHSENMNRLNLDIHEIKQKITSLHKETGDIQQKIQDLSRTHSYTRRDFTITFYSPGDTRLKLQVTYLVSNVTFSSSYDVRVGVNPPEPATCQLMYFAEVKNSSSEDWTNVKMAISTARPALGSVPPQLGRRRLRVKVDRPMRSHNKKMRKMAMPSLAMHSERDMASKMNEEQADDYGSSSEGEDLPQVAIITSTVEQSTLGSVTFQLPQPCNVPSDGKGHKVCIAMINLDMKIVHEAVPSLASHVYMRAGGKNTSPYLLLPGTVNVFLNGSFLTVSNLTLTNKDEQMQFYLGVDESVKLVIKPEEVVTGKTGLIKKTNVQNTKRSITVKNTKAMPIEIQITEPCPTSQDEAIKVKLHEPEIRENDKSICRDDKNNLQWNLTINAGADKTIGYHYSIEHATDKQIEYF